MAKLLWHCKSGLKGWNPLLHQIALLETFYGWNALFFANTWHVQQLNKQGTAAGVVEEL